MAIGEGVTFLIYPGFIVNSNKNYFRQFGGTSHTPMTELAPLCISQCDEIKI